MADISMLNAPIILNGALDAIDSANLIAQSTGSSNGLVQALGAVGSTGDALKPFVPLIAAVTVIITEIISVYEAAQYNKKICNALMDRVESAQFAVMSLQRRKKENEYKFRDQAYYKSFVRFVEVLKKIKGFIQDVSQLQGFRKFTKALSVQEKFNALIQEFDQVVRDLSLSLAIANEDQRKVDHEALEEDLADMKVYLANIEGGITNQNKQISNLLEEFSLLKSKVDQREPSTLDIRANHIYPEELLSPLVRRSTDIRRAVTKKMWKTQDVAVKPFTFYEENNKGNSRAEIELALLGKLREGKNIIQFHGLSRIDGTNVMVLEWAERGNLREVYQAWDIDWPTKIKIATDICRGITFLHAVNIFHHDIRCENILLTDRNEPKIANFHLSRYAQTATTNIKQKVFEIVHWLAPENYGMLLWELGHAKIPYADWNFQRVQEHVCQGERETLNLDSHSSRMEIEYAKVIREAWSHDPYLRPTLQEIFLTLNNIIQTFLQDNTSPGLSPRTPSSLKDIPSLSLSVYSSTKRQMSGPRMHLSSEDLPEFDFKVTSLPITPLLPLEDGIKAHKAGERQKAWECFQAHAELGNTTAIYWKGYYLWEGYCGVKDRKTAAFLFKKSADDGIADAQLRYAFCMVMNEGVKFNRNQFLQYLKLSADNGNPSAQFNLGDVYLFGKLGVPKNEQEGERYMRLAALKNQPKAIEILKKRNVDPDN
ncbi:hypothetical protein G9A89_006599 [Geosiphon pyriformis]|nr:hypothetical protein G9A89_006599 [Geosiphon pyriformis]